jgi:dihydrofolate synthase/folylpolyglutamate synthase
MKFLDAIAARARFGMKPGLDAISSVCERLGSPHLKTRAIHVAGTNGKGAVCAMLDACLGGGRFTSPHLVRLNERFFLHGEPVGDGTLSALCDRVEAVCGGDMTFFEVLTAMAFLLYSEIPDEYTVMETGLGGRFDATNICRPELTVITRIGLDHCDWLGDTLAKIAGEKAGIIKRAVPVVVGRNEDEAIEVISDRAKALGAPFYYAPDLVDESEIPEDMTLKGGFNRENAQTAIAALKVLGVGFDGIARAVWPGRFQRVGGFIVDGAHNPPAARALVRSLEGRKVDLIAGFCGDKDVDAVLGILAPCVYRAYAVATNNPRSVASEALAARMSAAGMNAVACGNLREAMEAAQNRPEAAGSGDVLVCGSLFLAGEALVELGAYPWGETRFDRSESLKQF